MRAGHVVKIWIRLMCLITAGVIAVLTGCTGSPPELHSTGTPSLPPVGKQTSSAHAEATVNFPGVSGLEATVTNRPQTKEMQAALPSQSSLDQVVDLDMKTGVFPSSGAELTFSLDLPLPAEQIMFIVNWDVHNQSWAPVASETSPDGKSISAKLAHFSTYGLEIWSNFIGRMVGVRTNPPECPAPPPEWDDNSVQFYEDLNGPVLWCATTDPDHPDDLKIKLRLNRGAAASITTAVKPVWVQSDLWQGVTPETWATMVLSGPDALIPGPDTYFIQPTGEFSFRFNKTDLLNFWHSNRSTPLIAVDATVPYVLAGLLYNQASDASVVPALSLVTTYMALTQCLSEIIEGLDLVLSHSSLKSFASELPGMMARLAPCLSAKSKPIAQAAAKFWATKDPTSTIAVIEKSAALASKSILAAAQIYAAVQVLAPVADALTDLLLDPIARQFIFQPSDLALKAFLGPTKAELGSVVAPAMCNRPEGQLVDGRLPMPKNPGGPDPGVTELYGNNDGSYMRTVGDTSTGTQGLTALVFRCGIGGVAWPATVAIYDRNLQLITSLNLSDIDHKEHSDVDAIRFENHALRVDWRTNPDGEAGACVTVHKTGRFVLSPIPNVVPSLSLTPQDIHVVSQDRCH
ncbi:hypothetical protein DBR22_19830 [Arthrobacter sp. HMWF013]|nr:hypothetical protein DBR22_19830 [Arthrobacter sp. HMWF013]